MFQLGWAERRLDFGGPVMLQGQMHVRISEAGGDALVVSALALSGEDSAALLVACDLAKIPEDLLAATRAALAARLPEFDPSLLVMNATHTHTGPVLHEGAYPCPAGVEVVPPADCLRIVAEQAAEAAAAAWQGRGPGGLLRGFGHAVIGHNRRASYFNGTTVMYGATNRPDFSHVEGYEDHSLDLLFTVDGSGRLTGVVVNLACTSQETENDLTLSADFWHEAREELRRRFGPDLFVLPQCSAAGDQSPHLLLHRKAEQYMLARRGLTMRQELARRLANAVEDVYAVVQTEVETAPRLAHTVETLELPGRRITQADYLAAQQELASREDRDSESSWRPLQLRGVMAAYESGGAKPPVTIELHVLRLGEIALATNPFELYLDYGERIKARSAAEQTFVVQLACGAHGYLPTARALGQSYSGRAADNQVGPEGGQLLVERSLELIGALWAD